MGMKIVYLVVFNKAQLNFKHFLMTYFLFCATKDTDVDVWNDVLFSCILQWTTFGCRGRFSIINPMCLCDMVRYICEWFTVDMSTALLSVSRCLRVSASFRGCSLWTTRTSWLTRAGLFLICPTAPTTRSRQSLTQGSAADWWNCCCKHLSEGGLGLF